MPPGSVPSGERRSDRRCDTERTDGTAGRRGCTPAARRPAWPRPSSWRTRTASRSATGRSRRHHLHRRPRTPTAPCGGSPSALYSPPARCRSPGAGDTSHARTRRRGRPHPHSRRAPLGAGSCPVARQRGRRRRRQDPPRRECRRLGGRISAIGAGPAPAGARVVVCTAGTSRPASSTPTCTWEHRRRPAGPPVRRDHHAQRRRAPLRRRGDGRPPAGGRRGHPGDRGHGLPRAPRPCRGRVRGPPRARDTWPGIRGPQAIRAWRARCSRGT